MSIGYGFVFLMLAAAAMVVALLSPWVVGVAARSAALSFFVVACAYLGGGPRLLLKRADGRRPGWAWAVHWLFFALAAVSYRLAVLTSHEPALVRVAPNVFFGRRLTAAEVERAEALHGAAVLDLAAELTDPLPLRTAPGYRSLPLLDATAPTRGQLRDAADWIAARAANGPVYVHCALGHGRSATVVAAYLLAAGLAPDAATAVKHLRTLRPGVRLNRAQWAALSAFAGLATSAPSA